MNTDSNSVKREIIVGVATGVIVALLCGLGAWFSGFLSQSLNEVQMTDLANRMQGSDSFRETLVGKLAVKLKSEQSLKGEKGDKGDDGDDGQPGPPGLDNFDAIGAVLAYAGQISKLPKDWHVCDGSELNKEEYPKLFDVLGTVYGGNGNRTFKLPDYRGYFLRGLDSTKQVDQESRELGSIQMDQFEKHFHTLMNANDKPFQYGIREGDKGEGLVLSTGVDKNIEPIHNDPKGGSETRPKNIAVHWVIRIR